MQRIVFLFLLFNFSINAQINTQEDAVKKVITTFFEGLHNGDSILVKKTIHPEIKIQTTFTNKKGEKLLRTQTKGALLKGIASKKATDIYFEKLLSYTIKIDGNLASVWTPYEFYFNEKFSHCGANSFQLFNDGVAWKIIFLVDMRRRQTCIALKDKK